MTTKKAITKKARAIRSTIKGLTLPQSVKLAKASLRGDNVAINEYNATIASIDICDCDESVSVY